MKMQYSVYDLVFLYIDAQKYLKLSKQLDTIPTPLYCGYLTFNRLKLVFSRAISESGLDSSHFLHFKNIGLRWITYISFKNGGVDYPLNHIKS